MILRRRHDHEFWQRDFVDKSDNEPDNKGNNKITELQTDKLETRSRAQNEGNFINCSNIPFSNLYLYSMRQQILK